MKTRLHLQESLNWLKHAQDTSKDGGVAAWFSLVTGWAPSYIETTGYIINTFLDAADYFNDDEYLKRASTMGDFLVKMQHSSGGYRTHVPEVRKDSVPTVFNTGQDLIGMSALYARTKNKKYQLSLMKAADFLVSIQEKDGSWLKNTYGNKTHVYHTRVAWGLLESWKVTAKKAYYDAAIKNLNWALSFQQPNGWFRNNELPPPNIQVPYTHTIAYAIEGFLWSGLLLQDKKYLHAAVKGAEPVLKYYLKNDFIPGTFDSQWHSNDKYSCLTGDAQIAVVWFALYELTGRTDYLQGAQRITNYLKSKQNVTTIFNNIKGAIPGSWPIWGDIFANRGYCRLAYLNWATKFFIDALFLEIKLTK